MKKELTEVYCGSAKGKTTLALGHSLRAAAEGKSVIIIQFLKGKETRSVDFWSSWMIWILRFSVLKKRLLL